MLHLHRFDHRDLLTGADEVAVCDVERDDRPLQRRGDGDRSLGSFERGRPRVACVRLGGVEIGFSMLPARKSHKLGTMRLHEARVDAVRDEIRVGQQRLEEGELVATPAMRNSPSARASLAASAATSGPCATTLATRELNATAVR